MCLFPDHRSFAMYLDRAKERLRTLNFVRSDEIVPCSEDEINALEYHLGLSLPQAYREFLLWMGHSGGGLLRGSDCFYKHLPHLREWAVELLEEDNFHEPLPDDAFVFFMHQGYQFAFFRLSEGDDPPVYYYHESTDQSSFVISHRSFSEFLIVGIEDEAILAKSMSTTPLTARPAGWR
jgi:hypothetical protein